MKYPEEHLGFIKIIDASFCVGGNKVKKNKINWGKYCREIHKF